MHWACYLLQRLERGRVVRKHVRDQFVAEPEPEEISALEEQQQNCSDEWAALREELGALKGSSLNKRAREAHLTDEAMDEAEDGKLP